ncbi:hypothetical protein [Ochrobactrum chromiisoli]|uniref:Uncharacterized protein n=1 Tax=Ochrobactrum chromiisoli TaxID=2993941 RepID=A0ABT3QRA6_9HYPH|nr:hypothetical protein [Ochrobactrum chromiisoli]MCX2698157.1 hypothetical protein [Ochrobactrum chromiisoli]
MKHGFPVKIAVGKTLAGNTITYTIRDFRGVGYASAEERWEVSL